MCREGVKLERRLFVEMLLQPLHKLKTYTYGEIEFLAMNLEDFGVSCYIDDIPASVFKRRYGINEEDLETIRKDKDYITVRMQHTDKLLNGYEKEKMKEEMSFTTNVIGVNLDVADRLLKKGYTCRQVCVALGVMYPCKYVNRIRTMVKRLYTHGEDVANKATWLMYLIRRGVTLVDIVKENEDVFPSVQECRKVLYGAGFTKARVNWVMEGTRDWSSSRVAV